MRVRTRVILGAVLLLAGAAAGAVIGASSRETSTVVTTERATTIKTVDRIETVTRRQTVRETLTEVVTEPPTTKGVFVDYAQFDGAVKLQGIQWYRREYGGQEVVGQLEVLDTSCTVASYVEISATFFDSGGTIVENGFTNETDVAAGSRVPFTLGFDNEESSGRIEIVITALNC